MEEKRYIISEAAEKTGIESHVLRYWEDELNLDIPRNEMGHRYYTENQLQLFRQIKELKDSGFQLKAVKTVLESATEAPKPAEENPQKGGKEVSDTENANSARPQQPETEAAVTDKGTTAALTEQRELEIKRSEDKLAQFEQIIGDIVMRALMANNRRLGEDISCVVTEQVSNKILKEMDYMMRIQEEAEDERFKKLDETIRGVQKSSREAAVFRDKRERKKRRKLFQK